MVQKLWPRVHTMVVCDGAEESKEEDDVYHLIGVRAVLKASALPAIVDRLYVFLHMSAHHGEARFHVQIDRVETGDIIHQTKSKAVAFNGPESIEPVLFRMRNCVFPAAGLYYVQVYNDAKLIAERALHVREED